MSLRLRTAQAGSSRKSGKGLRIGAVRFLPRGVRKRDYARKNYFDVWLPILAPSHALLSQFKKLGMPTQTFFRSYRAEMQQTDPWQTIALLAAIAKVTPLTLCCYCEDETRCHRSVLFQLIRQAAQSH